MELGLSLSGAAADFAARTGKEISRAQRSGMRKAGGVVRRTFKRRTGYRGGTAPVGQLGQRTGLYRSSIKLKTFQYGNGTWGSSIKVKGRRAFVFRLHETGYTSRGVSVSARAPGQASLAEHAAEIPRLIERFISAALDKV